MADKPKAPEILLTSTADGRIKAQCPWCPHAEVHGDKKKSANRMVGHFAGRHSDLYLIGNPYRIDDQT